MNLMSFRTAVALMITTGAGAVAAIVVASCGSGSPAPAYDDNGSDSGSSSGASGSSSGGGSSGSGGRSGGDMDATLVSYDGPPPNVDGGQLSCATPDGLPIKFNPMYSGFDGVHMYQVPTFVVGVDPASVTWGASDPTMVAMQPYVNGIMITTKKAGDVTIVATVGTKCGSAPLHVTQFTADDWMTGNARYNNGNDLVFTEDGGLPFDASIPADGNFSGFDAGALADAGNCMSLPPTFTNPFENPPAACTQCHGSVGNGKLFGMTLFSDVSHTPEQTGGFSDDDLTNVILHGTVPPGGYFDNTIICYPVWHQLHTWWDIATPAAQKGIVAYLRSLPPKEQLGCFDLLNPCDGG
jgi:hypothetical protein